MVTRAGIPSPIVRPAFVKSKPLPHHQTTTMQPSHRPNPVFELPGVAHGLIGKEVFIWREKIPYVASGAAVRGVLALDPTKTKVMCHDCGQWFKTLGQHVLKCPVTGGQSGREYRLRHGLALGQPLCPPVFSARCRSAMLRNAVSHAGFRNPDQIRRAVAARAETNKNGSPAKSARANLARNCEEQLPADFLSLHARLGRIPSLREFDEFRSGLGGKKTAQHAVMSAFGMSWNEFCEWLLSIPRAPGAHTRYSRQALVELLLARYRSAGRMPTYGRGNKPHGWPSVYVLRFAFGSVSAAFEAAGLGLVYRKYLSIPPTKRANAIG